MVAYKHLNITRHVLLQLINLNKHLSKSSIDIAAKIPNPDFSGVAVIDWEGWRPLWETNFGKKRIYRTKSAQLIEEEKVFKKKDEIAREAKKKFEKAARDIMVGTLNLAKKLRPKALWGFYGFPGCYGNITTGYTCRTQVIEKINFFLSSGLLLMNEIVKNGVSDADLGGGILDARPPFFRSVAIRH